jgi:hypothetical protein
MKIHQFQVYLAAIGVLICSGTICAQSNLGFTTLRQFGMGGTGIAQTFDSAALYTNPAGLSKAKSEVRLPLTFRLDMNDSVLNNLSVFSDIAAEDSMSARIDILNSANLIPSTLAIKGALSPAFSISNSNFAFAILGATNIYSKFSNPVSPVISISGFSDLSPMIGVSDTYSVFGQKVSVGASLMAVYRTRIVEPSTGAFTVVRYYSDMINEDDKVTPISQTTMSGFGGNVGALVPFGNGHIGAVIYNLGTPLTGTTASGNSVSETLPVFLGMGIAQTIDGGSLPLVGSLIGDFSAAADLRLQYSDMYKNIFLGVEKSVLGGAIKVRAGLYQGYPTVGLGVDTFLCHAQYAFYTEELGDHVGDNPVSYQGIELGFLF